MKIDTTQITIGGVQPYIFFVGIGSVIALFIFNLLIYREKLNIIKSNITILISVFPLLIGAKLVGTVYSLANCFYYGIEINLKTFIYSGIVFYGGLLFFIASIKILTLRWKCEDKYKIFDCIALIIPCFHFWGRIGCFYAGCCYGIKYKGLISFLYVSHANGKIVEEWRLPIQIIEAICNLVLFGFLVFCKRKNLFKNKLILVYLIIYAIARFVIEFFRGDWDRNVFYPFSGSQIIGIIVFLVTVILLELRRKENV